MDNPFSWDYLTTVPGPNEVFGPFSVTFLIVFTIGFLVSLVVYNGWAKRWFHDPVLHRMAKRWAGMGLILFTIGLLLFLIRWLQIDPFSLGMRLWMWLAWVGLIAWLGYILYDYKRHYTDLRLAYEQQQQRRELSRPMTKQGRGKPAGSSTVPTVGAPRPVRRKPR